MDGAAFACREPVQGFERSSRRGVRFSPSSAAGRVRLTSTRAGPLLIETAAVHPAARRRRGALPRDTRVCRVSALAAVGAYRRPVVCRSARAKMNAETSPETALPTRCEGNAQRVLSRREPGEIAAMTRGLSQAPLATRRRVGASRREEAKESHGAGSERVTRRNLVWITSLRQTLDRRHTGIPGHRPPARAKHARRAERRRPPSAGSRTSGGRTARCASYF